MIVNPKSIALKLKFEFGLNPLLVTFSPLIENECGVFNRNELSKKVEEKDKSKEKEAKPKVATK